MQSSPSFAELCCAVLHVSFQHVEPLSFVRNERALAMPQVHCASPNPTAAAHALAGRHHGELPRCCGAPCPFGGVRVLVLVLVLALGLQHRTHSPAVLAPNFGACGGAPEAPQRTSERLDGSVGAGAGATAKGPGQVTAQVRRCEFTTSLVGVQTPAAGAALLSAPCVYSASAATTLNHGGRRA